MSGLTRAEKRAALKKLCERLGWRKKGMTGEERMVVMRAVGRARGGDCLGTEWEGGESELRWRCSEGHRWGAVPNSVKNGGTWCGVCARFAKYDDAWRTRKTAELRQLVGGRGSRLLSEYVNSKTKVHIDCGRGGTSGRSCLPASSGGMSARNVSGRGRKHRKSSSSGRSLSQTGGRCARRTSTAARR